MVENNKRSSSSDARQQQQHHHPYHHHHFLHLHESSIRWTVKLTDLKQFDACQAQAELFRTDDKLHLRNLCNDTARNASLIAIHTSQASFKQERGGAFGGQHHKLILDYSRQRVTGETMEQLFDMADAVDLTTRLQNLAEGAPINATEGKPVLHHVLRMPAYSNLELKHHVTIVPDTIGIGHGSGGLDSPPPPVPINPLLASSAVPKASIHAPVLPLDGPTVLKQVHDMRKRIQDFAYRVRSGEYVSATGQHVFKNTIVVATGGTHLATDCVSEALQADPDASIAAGHDRQLRFCSHADPVNAHIITRDLQAAETLIIIISTTFHENPVMLNARTLVQWLVQDIQRTNPIKNWKREQIVAKHVLAVTYDKPAPIQRCHEFGITVSNIFPIPTWVSPRHSVCSAVGLLPLSLQYSYPVMSDFLDGANDMDEHFFHAPLRDNVPVILGLLGVWNSTFLGLGCRAILPYSKALHRFPAYVQHVDMESNGKRVALDGTPLLHRSGEIDFGDSDGQHSFFQLLHQGRVVPADFIGFMESQQPTDLRGEAVSNHDELMANFFAQPDALAYGKTLMDLTQEGTAEPLREHMVFTGNRPSSSLLLTRLDAFTMGQLIALYEHRTAVQGFIWGINSFDQFGNQLGSVLARHVRAQLSASRKTNASVQGFNASTSTLLEHYLAHGKGQQQQQQQEQQNGDEASSSDTASP